MQYFVITVSASQGVCDYCQCCFERELFTTIRPEIMQGEEDLFEDSDWLLYLLRIVVGVGGNEPLHLNSGP